jgi:proline iminopeptidase
MKNTFHLLLCLSFLIIASCNTTDERNTGIDNGFIKSSHDIELYYQILGAGRDTIVVIHGGPGAGMNSVMKPLLPLAEDFVLLLYDQRGGGKSTLPEDTGLLHAHYFIEDLEAVRQHFNLESMNILAHSFGSLIGAEYAKQNPERVCRMVFTGAVGPSREQTAIVYRASPPSPDTALSNRAGELLSELLTGSADDPVANCMEYEKISRMLAELRGETVTWTGTSCDAAPEAVAYYYQFTAQITPRSFGNWDYTSGMDHVKAPLLVIHSDQDTLGADSQHSWASALPNGKLAIILGAGKSAVTDRPDMIRTVIKEFFDN